LPGGNIVIQASRNLTIDAAMSFGNQTAGQTVSFQAGNSLTVNGSVGVAGGNLSLTASAPGFLNSTTAGALAVNADLKAPGVLTLNAGTGGISEASGVKIETGVLSVASRGGITQAPGGSIRAGTLLAGDTVSGSVNLAGVNRLANLGSFAVADGDFRLNAAGSLSVSGPVTANNIALNAETIALPAFGTIAAPGTVSLSAQSGGVQAGYSALLSAGTLSVSAAGGGFNDYYGTVSAGRLTSASGIAGGVVLNGAETIQALGSLAVTGGLSVANQGSVTLSVDGPVNAGTGTVRLSSLGIGINGSLTAGQVFLLAGTGGIAESAGGFVNAGTAGLAFTTGNGFSQQSNATLIAGSLGNYGTIVGDVVLAGTANAIGTATGIAPTSGSIAIVSTGSLSIAALASASTIAVSAPVLTVTGSLVADNINLSSAQGTLTLNGPLMPYDTAPSAAILSGRPGVTQNQYYALTLGTVIANSGSGSVSLLSTANTFGTVSGSAAGGFNVIDASALTVAGTLSAANAGLKAPSVALTGTAAVPGTLSVTAGTGGIAFSGGQTVSASVLDLSTAGGGIVQNSAGSIAATTLRSSAGIAGTVSLAGIANQVGTIGAITLTSGDFAMANGGSVVVAGLLKANNVTISAPTLTVAGAIGAAGKIVLSAAAGGIAETAAGLIYAPAVSLSSLGGVAQAGGTIIAGTLLSTGGVTGNVSLTGFNYIDKIGAFAVSGGDFVL
jgi:filamentous hemagglutinin